MTRIQIRDSLACVEDMEVSQHSVQPQSMEITEQEGLGGVERDRRVADHGGTVYVTSSWRQREGETSMTH